MRERLLEILREPTTAAPLRLEGARTRDGQIEEGELVSEVTGKKYPIVRGIPRFVDSEGYTGSFGMQWNKFRTVQVDSETTAQTSRRRFEAEAGWTEEKVRGKWMLDAGCGAGRFAEIAAELGGNLVAMDLSSAVEAAKETVARYPHVDVVQGSLLDPPFGAGTFDYVYCIGVIQHTPDPPRGVRTLAEITKPGGEFAFSIYARRPWTKLNAKYVVRPLTRRLPNQVLLGGIEKAMPVLFPVTDVLFRLPVVGPLFQFTIPVANYVHNRDFSREQRYAEAVLDTFDMLSPRFDGPMTWQEVERALREAGASRWEFRTRVPINCVGIR